MSDITFPQPADLPDAALFAFQSGLGRSGIVSGLGFTLDSTVSPPELTVDAGKAVVDRGNMTTAHPDIDPQETVLDAVAVVQIDPQTITLDTGSLNSIFLVSNVGNDDSANVRQNTTATRPGKSSLKIGEVDTSTDPNTISEGWNRLADDGTLTFPDESAADKQSNFLQEGTQVFDRETNTHFAVV